MGKNPLKGIDYPWEDSKPLKKALKPGKKSGALSVMSPEQFLKHAKRLKNTKENRLLIDSFKDGMKKGKKFKALKLLENNMADGRHRATAAMEVGIEQVPVIDYRDADLKGSVKGCHSVEVKGRKVGRKAGGRILQDEFPTHYLPHVGRQVMADGGEVAGDVSFLEDEQPEPQHQLPTFARPETQVITKALDAANAVQSREATMQAYEPTIREKIYDTLAGTSEARPTAERSSFAQGIADILGLTPVVGQAMQAQEASRAGDKKGVAMAVLPMPAGRAGAAAEEAATAGAQRLTNALGMHSPGAEAARALPQEKGTVEQVLAMLRKNVPEHELQHSGIEEMLKGKTHTTREEVAQHFESKLPHIEEMTLKDAPGHDAPKFEEWSMPGGSNYREVILHEGRTPQDYPKPFKDANDAQNAHDAALDRLDFRGAEEIDRQWREQVSNMARNEEEAKYYSDHFPEIKNYLAHVRMKDYDLPGNEKGLLTDELQSDRAQEGRKIGFADKARDEARMQEINASIEQNRSQRAELQAQINKAYEERVRKNAASSGHDPEELLRLAENRLTMEQKARNAGAYDLYQQLFDLGKEHALLREEANKIGRAMQPAPYMMDTHHWTDLTLKRALKEAVEGGYDRLMITPGAEHADRYNMRKQLNSIMWSPDTNKLVAIGTNGMKVIDREVPKEKLGSYIGKELADRLIQTEPVVAGNAAIHTLSEEGLEIGGEGMKGFYDKTVLRRLEKLLRKYDKNAKIEPYDLPTDKKQTYQWTGEDIPLSRIDELFLDAFRNKAPPKIVSGLIHLKSSMANGVPFKKAMEIGGSPELAEMLGGKLEPIFEKKRVHSVKITPELRKALQEKGLPAFKKGGRVDAALNLVRELTGTPSRH